MQMNLCLSGLGGCYGKVAYPAVLQEAVVRIREAHPDAVTFNEACRNDVARIARRTGYHMRFSRVIYFGEPFSCLHPVGRGLYGDAVLTKAPVESSDSRPFEAQAGPERRDWLCVTTRVDVEVCTAHLATRDNIEVAANGPQCVELDAVLARHARVRSVIFAVTSTVARPARPAASGHAPTARPSKRPAFSRSTEPARSARPWRRWCRPHIPTTTTCWSAPS
jgi:hypothetical protein